MELSREAAVLRPHGNLIRHLKVRKGDVGAARAQAHVVVTGEYEVGMQDQAFLGPESGLAVPAEDGGVDLFIATQWLHVDRDQLAASLDLPPEKVRLVLGGVGGAFGGREDLSMQVHACLLALDCGAYASSSTAVCSNAACFACGPYEVPNARIDAYVVYTDNPPCGAMRGFGAVQTCFAHEAQMDKLAAALEMDPVDLRRGRRARRRLRRGLQEHRLLGGLRRLLDRARADLAGGRRAAGGGPHRR